MNMEIASRDDDASRIFEMNFIAESRLKNSYLIKQKTCKSGRDVSEVVLSSHLDDACSSFPSRSLPCGHEVSPIAVISSYAQVLVLGEADAQGYCIWLEL